MIIGARPNYMKAYPLYLQLLNKFSVIFIHTGQHYDDNMNKIFMDTLKLPIPYKQYNLVNNGQFGGTRAGKYEDILYGGSILMNNLHNIANELNDVEWNDLGQIGEIRKYLINDMLDINPDYVMVFGDVTSTLAAALAARMLNIKLVHVEAGLRSFDISMPEEVNRIIVDHISNILLITQKSGYDNVKNEHIEAIICCIDNPMIECLKLFEEKARKTCIYEKYGLTKKKYILVTLHRPNNVDNPIILNKICGELNLLGHYYDIIFPVHPRTKKNIYDQNIVYEKIKLIDPIDYISFLSLTIYSYAVITDSGGIQEETTYLGIPCYTYRNNTERPDTLICNGGTNQLVDHIDINMFCCMNTSV